MDYYEVLGIQRTANFNEIRKAYRQKARLHHPDTNLGNKEQATELFKKVKEAYDILGDPIKRSHYDGKQPHNSRPKPRSADFNSVFEEFFGGGVNRGRNIQVRVECELTDILRGCTKHIIVKKRQCCHNCDGKGYSTFVACPTCGGSGFSEPAGVGSPFEFSMQCTACQGSGKHNIERCDICAGAGFGAFTEKALVVQIPQGIDNGMQVRVQGEGEEGKIGSKIGDLFVVVLIKDHPIFKREGRDLYCDVPVSYTQLVLGAEIELPTLDKSMVKVKVPSGTQTHTRFRMKGRGLPDIRSPLQLGDIVATVKIESPTELCEGYREVLEKLADLENKHPTPKCESFKKKVYG